MLRITERSVAGSVPILSRIRPRDVSLAELDDRLATAKRRRTCEVHIVSHCPELRDDAVRYGGLDDHPSALLVSEAAGVHRLLNIHTEYEHVDEELRMALRLHATPFDGLGDLAAAAF